MRNPDGYATVVGDLSKGAPTLFDPHTGTRHSEMEVDTFQCGHCQRVVHVPPLADPAQVGGGCRICMSNICSRCVDLGTCSPWQAKMEEIERKHDLNTMTSRLVGR